MKGLGKLRYVVEQSFVLLHQFRRARRTLPNAAITYTCAHSITDVHRSSGSGLQLAAGDLTVEEITRLLLSRTWLTYLSCAPPRTAATCCRKNSSPWRPRPLSPDPGTSSLPSGQYSGVFHYFNRMVNVFLRPPVTFLIVPSRGLLGRSVRYDLLPLSSHDPGGVVAGPGGVGGPLIGTRPPLG